MIEKTTFKHNLLFYVTANELELIGIFLIKVLVLGIVSVSNKVKSLAKLIKCHTWKWLYMIKSRFDWQPPPPGFCVYSKLEYNEQDTISDERFKSALLINIWTGHC